jgi:plasmid stabilization system protein ParE
VPRLIYRKKARRDLADITASIERESRDRAAANAFVNKLFRFCEHLGQPPGLLGRPRPEYGRDYRSVTFGSYIIFMRYVDKGSERSQMHILHVLHGSRDMDAYFSEQPDDEGKFGLNEENPIGYVAYASVSK